MYVIYFFKENEQNISQYILKVKYESLVHGICKGHRRKIPCYINILSF